MKMLLRKNIKPHPLRFEELYTLLVDAEATINSRPITPLHADDAQEDLCLTAGHFLIGRPLRAPPSPQPSQARLSTLRRWNLTSRLTADLWKQWLSIYLASCDQRAKWHRQGHRLSPGDLVFIKDESLRICQWPLARVEDIYRGDDGEIRAARLRCRGKLYDRPTCKLIPFLPDEDSTTTRPGSMFGTSEEPKQ